MHSFENLGTTVDTAVQAVGSTVLSMKADPDFILAHYPTEWELVPSAGGGWDWLPRLKKLPLTPGVNGVRATRNGIDDRIARTTYQDRGWTLIPRSHGYVVRYPTTRGPTFLLKWDVPKKLGNKVVLKHDAEGYNAWRLQLVAEGLIERPDPDALAPIRERLQRTISRNEKSAHLPGIADKLEEDRDRLSAMAPKKKRPAKRAKPSA